MNSLKSYRIGFIGYYDLYIIILLVFFDYISKYYLIYLLGNKKIEIIGQYLFLEIYKNDGIAFSIQLPFLKIITALIIVGIIYYYTKYERIKKNRYLNYSFILIIAGALGNAWERIFIGEVTDFIGIKYFSIFNFADIYVNLGIIIYLIIIVLKKDKEGI